MNVRIFFYTLLFVFSIAGSPAMADSPQTGDEIQVTVNVNTASAEELATLLSGVGLSKANAIVMYRDKNGPFESQDELSKVKGIGTATIAKNAQRLRVK